MKSVEEYILSQDKDRQEMLSKVRQIFKQVVIDGEERISWGMPTYKKRVNVIHFALAKKHLGIYPGPETVEYFSDILTQKGYEHTKGVIRFPFDKIDYALIEEICKHAYKVNI